MERSKLEQLEKMIDRYTVSILILTTIIVVLLTIIAVLISSTGN